MNYLTLLEVVEVLSDALGLEEISAGTIDESLQQTIGVYALKDYLMSHNLKGQVAEQATMEREMKAIIQQYMVRMIENRLIP